MLGWRSPAVTLATATPRHPSIEKGDDTDTPSPTRQKGSTVATTDPAFDRRVERARLAVTRFRKMTPQLTGFARMITRRSNVRVMITGEGPHTDGTNIFLKPPISLGDRIEHDRHLCGDRDLYGPVCPACRRQESIMMGLYHEIAHIAFESFSPVTDTDKRELLMKALTEAGDPSDEGTRAGKIKKHVETGLEAYASSSQGVTYMALAGMISPYLPTLLNALEDWRVNTSLITARPGTKRAFEDRYRSVLELGIPDLDGTVSYWQDRPLDSQLIIAILNDLCGYSYDVLDEQVVEAMNSETMRAALAGAYKIRSVRGTYQLSFKVLEAARELGFLRRADDPEDDMPLPGPDAEPDDTDTGGDDDSTGGESDESKPGGESDSDEPGDEDSTGSSTEPTDEPTDDEESSDGTGPDAPDTKSTDEPTDSDTAEGDEPDDDADLEPADDGDDTEADGDDDSDGTSSGEGTDTDDESDDSEAGSSDDGDDTERDDDGEGGEGDADKPATWDEDDDTDDTDGGDTDSDGTDSGDKPEKDYTDTDEQEGESSDSGSELEDGPTMPDDTSDPEQVKADLDKFLGHDSPINFPLDYEEPTDDPDGEGDEPIVEETEEDDKEINRAINQAEHFDKPSDGLTGVNIHTDPDDTRVAMGYSAWGRLADAEAGKHGMAMPTESILGGSLLRMRATFADNAKRKNLTNLKSGRVNARTLGRRVTTGDDRLFHKPILPGKRDYFVVLGLDVSGSTSGRTIQQMKAAIYAQAELLSRVGVPFAMYAHSGSPSGASSEWDWATLALDMYVIKSPDQPWDTKAKDRLFRIYASAANLDGHTLEFYRKVLDERRETDRIIMYYTDGSMPAENYNEELSVLVSEIAKCKQRGYHLMAVGCGNTEPEGYGLPTVSYNGPEDVPAVVKFLEKRLISGGVKARR